MSVWSISLPMKSQNHVKSKKKKGWEDRSSINMFYIQYGKAKSLCDPEANVKPVPPDKRI